MKRFMALFLCALMLVQSGGNIVRALPSSELQVSSQIQERQSGQGMWYIFNLEETPLVGGINQAYARQGNSADKPAKEAAGNRHNELKQNGKTVGHVSQNKVILKYDGPGQQKKEFWDPIKVNLKNNPAPMMPDVHPWGTDGIQMRIQSPANTESDALQLCRDYYADLEIEWNDDYYEAKSGECNLDIAIEKYVNRGANQRFGKNFFATGNAEDPKNDWAKPTIQTEREFVFTFPDGLAPKSVSLEVANAEGKNHCKVDTDVLPQGDLTSECPKEPNANFLIACVGSVCTFRALNQNADSYRWELKNDPANRKAYQYGKEPRIITLDETMQIQCQPGWVYEENPNSPLNAREIRCVNPASNINAQSGFTSATSTADDENYALMGFTLAPVYQAPTQTIYVDMDLWIVDFSFSAAFDFKASLELGLRLPIQVNMAEPEGWSEGVWAGSEHSIETSITPKDFFVDEYKNVCLDNELADGTVIHDCDAFSFPDFLNPNDGDEFAARFAIESGITVTPVDGDPWSVRVPLVDFDLGKICTVSNMLSALSIDDGDIDKEKLQEIMENLATLGADFFANGNGDLYEFLKDQSILCGSFTTPYGYADGELRTFPFIPEAGYDIPSNCADVDKITFKGNELPICTGLYLGVPLASIGVGLNLKVQAGSDVISAGWNTAGDAKPVLGVDTSRVRWIWDDENTYEDHSMPHTIGPIRFDNYDLERSLDHDIGSLVLDNFNYHLNFFLTISAGLEFGGILSPLSSLLDNTEIVLYRVSFRNLTGIDGIPIPQHAGMDPLKFSTDVKNYGLDVAIQPDEKNFPADLNPVFTSRVINIGSLPDSFDNFRIEVGNIPTASPIYNSSLVRFNPNNDFDCLGADNTHLGGLGKEIECYQSNGTAQPGVTLLINEDGDDGIDNDHDGLINEDPENDAWTAKFLHTPVVIENLNPYATNDSLQFAVTPFQHSMTRPGVYPIKLFADSVGSTVVGLPDLFPLPITSFGYDADSHVFGRRNAFDVAHLNIAEFANPQVTLIPGQSLALPGAVTTYNGVVVNGGNVTDTINLNITRPDLNQGNCSMITMGKNSACPYRALVTRLPDEWVTNNFNASYGPLLPGEYGTGTYIIRVPSDWAGMEDTPYQFITLVESTYQPGVSHIFIVTHTVDSTLESQTRYILTEINALIAEINRANAQGVKTCNLNSIASNSVKIQADKALQLIRAGRSAQALTALSTDLKIMQSSFMNGLRSCKSVPSSPWRTDWQLRAQAIINDLQTAVGRK